MSGCDAFDFEEHQDEFPLMDGLRGADGTTFYPHVSAEGILSWTNDGGKPNPAPVNIKGADGKSAYAAAAEAGFTGTEAEFNAYLSGIGDLTQEVADQKSAIDDLTDLVDRKAGALVDTVSGAIASFVPDSTIPDLLGVSVDVEPVQDLHGYENPWPGGGGKNKLPLTVSNLKTQNTAGSWSGNNYTVNGVTFSILTDSDNNVVGVNANGTASSSAYLSIAFDVLNEDYIVSGCPTGGSYNSSYSIWVISQSPYVESIDAGTGVTITENYSRSIRLRVASGYTASNIVFKPMIRLASVTDPTFAPYENLCPISGWNAVGIVRSGENLLNASTYTSTYYGVTFQYTDAPSVKISGTAERDIGVNSFLGDGGLTQLKAGTYTLKAFVSGLQRVNIYKRKNGANQFLTSDFGNGVTFALDEDATVFFYPVVSAGTTIDVTIYPQLVSGTTAGEYKPRQATTYTIALGDTVYRCKLAIAEDGSVTALIDRAAGVFDGSENITWQITADGSTRQNVYCNAHDKFRDIITTGGLAQFEINIFKAITNRADRGQYTAYLDNGYLNMQFPSGMFSSVAELKSWLSANNVQFTYPLDTPITIQLDPVTISTISGQTNNLWSDAGVVTVEFAADLKHYIDSKIAAAVAALS